MLPISTINTHREESEIRDSVNESVRTSQQQAISAWIARLKEIRVEDMLQKMQNIDYRKKGALNELKKLTSSVEKLTASNRGGEKGIHGFIGERAQVFIYNARSIMEGSVKISELIDDNGMTDYLENGIPIQQKACKSGGKNGLDHIQSHKAKYPTFSGKYHIPKDFFEECEKLKNMTEEEAGRLSRSERALRKEVLKIKAENIEIEPMVVDYEDIQRDTISSTIEREKDSIQKRAKKEIQEIADSHRPNLSEGVKAARISAAIEGGLSGATVIIEKCHDGKRIVDFNKQDYKDVGIETLKGTGKGAIRGSAIYVAENFTHIPGSIAGSAVTVVFDSATAIYRCNKGKLTKIECAEVIGESACVAATGALGAEIGNELCPIPVIGEIVGGFLFSFLAKIGYKYIKTNIELMQADVELKAA